MFLLFAQVREESGGEGCLFKMGACLTLWPSKWVLIWGVVLFTTWALICQAFSRAWSMSINSQSLFFSRKIDNRIRHLGWVCEHNLNPSPPGGFKQPILKSSNAYGLPRGDVESSNWPTHKILTVEVWHSHERAYGLWAISIDNEIFSAYELPSV